MATAAAVSVPKAWLAAERALSLVTQAAASTKKAGNEKFKAGLWATALYHYHSACFSLHGTAVCQLLDSYSSDGAVRAAHPSAGQILDDLRVVRRARDTISALRRAHWALLYSRRL